MLTKTKRPDRTMTCRVCGKLAAHRYIGPQHMPNRTLQLYNSRCCEATRVPEEQGETDVH